MSELARVRGMITYFMAVIMGGGPGGNVDNNSRVKQEKCTYHKEEF